MKSRRSKILTRRMCTICLSLLFCFSGCGKEEIPEQTVEIQYRADDGEYRENGYGLDIPALENSDTAKEKEKTILTLLVCAMQGADSNFAKYVKLFNNQSDDYYVEVITCHYGDELRDMRTRVNLEIASGGGPDLLVEDVFVVDNDELDKGAIVDLSPYLEESGITKETYFPGYASLVYKDKVYGITPYAGVVTYGIKEEVLGGQECPDMDTLLDRILTYPEEACFQFPQEAPGRTLRMLLRGSESVLGAVDWENKTCDFTIPIFSKALDVAKRCAEGAQKGCEPIAKSFSLSMATCGELENESQGYVLLGTYFDDGWYPTCFGSDILMINGNTKNLDGAYAFLSFLLTKTAKSYEINPIHREIWEKAYETNVKRIEAGSYHAELNEDIKQRLIEIYDNARYEPRRAKTVLNIVYEEADAFLTGQKSKEEVIDIIQRRVSMYLAE